MEIPIAAVDEFCRGETGSWKILGEEEELDPVDLCVVDDEIEASFNGLVMRDLNLVGTKRD